MELNKTQFAKFFLLWSAFFFGIGQWLFGCAPSTAELEAWSKVQRATALQQGLTDREQMRLLAKKKQDRENEQGKITILPVPEQLPTITTTTVTPGQPQYIDELGEVEREAKTVTVTKTDTTALAILQLGKVVALALAERAGGTVPPQKKDKGEPTRIVYQRYPMPKSNAPEVIKNTGTALKESGLVSGLLSGFLGWFAGNTVQEVSRVQGHTGDYVSLENSNNPVTTTYPQDVE